MQDETLTIWLFVLCVVLFIFIFCSNKIFDILFKKFLIYKFNRMKPRSNANKFYLSNDWGDSINFIDTNRVVGWKTPQPKIGDILIDNNSDKWIFVRKEECLDPPDMFFSTVWKMK